jgi:hypothetical protein
MATSLPDARKPIAQRRKASYKLQGTRQKVYAVKHKTHLALVVGGDASHIVVDGRNDRDGLLGHIYSRKNSGCLGDARKPLMQNLWRKVIEMKVDVVLLRAHAATLANLECHGSRYHVPGGEVEGGRCIAANQCHSEGPELLQLLSCWNEALYSKLHPV